jgi:hypothetical protein
MKLGLNVDDGAATVRQRWRVIEVPKNRLAVRLAVVQDSASRLLYATSVASSVAVLQRHLVKQCSHAGCTARCCSSRCRRDPAVRAAKASALHRFMYLCWCGC